VDNSEDIDLLVSNFRKYKCDTITVIIGAGSSNNPPSWSMPNWEGLLSCMRSGMENSLTPPSGIKRTSEDGIIAGVIENDIRRKSVAKINSTLRARGILTPNIMSNAMATSVSAYQLAAYVKAIFAPKRNQVRNIVKGDNVTRENSTAYVLAYACAQRAIAGIRTIVITYNYDDLFEFMLKYVLGIDVLNKPEIQVRPHVYSRSRDNSPYALHSLTKGDHKTIDIYYVHGRLPIFTDDALEPSAVSDGIILSDISYDDLAQNSYGFSNHIQRTAMTAFPTVTCGFSCTDRNFRRLRKEIEATNVSLRPLLSLFFCNEVCSTSSVKKCSRCGTSHICDEKKCNICEQACVSEAKEHCLNYSLLMEHKYQNFSPLPVKEGEYMQLFENILIPD